jgi:mRNA-degrading endonuclease RelE of RelBE toxin-antitoxin system
MKALFVELPAFERNRSAYLTDEAFRGLQNAMLKDPEAGDVIAGTGGLRKVRHGDATRGKGKRGGLRIIYYWWEPKKQFGFSRFTTRMSWTTYHRKKKPY